MNRGLKKAAVIALSSCLAMTALAGCSKKEAEFDGSKTALTVNGTTASAGLVKFVCHYTQAGVEDFYNMYFGAGAFTMAMDEAGTTIGDMTKSGTVAELTQMILAEQNMEAYGVTVTDEEKEAISAAAAAFIEANDAETLTLMAADQANVERYLELCTIQNKMEAVMGEDVDTEVSDEEAAQRKIQYVLFSAETEEEAESEAESEVVTEAATEAESAVEEEAATEAESEVETEAATEAETAVETEAATEAETAVETEAETAALEENDAEKTESADETEVETETEDPAVAAAMEEAYAKAAEMIELIKAGEEFEAAALAVDAELTVSDMTFDADDTVVNEEFITATEGLEDGTLVETPIEGASGYYVVQLVTQLDREATDARKEEIIEERKAELITNLYTEWEEAAEISQEDDVLEQIVFDFSLTLESETETEAGTEAAEAASEAGTEAATEAATEAVTE